MRAYFLLTTVAILGINVVSLFYLPEVLWSMVVFGPLILLGLFDITQKSHSILRNFPVLGHMLSARIPGLNIQGTSGASGAGGVIRLRGNSSVAMSNAPLVYIDGVRVRSDSYPKNVPPTGYSGRGHNTLSSPLNDINPNDVERVEVIKGAAATTLYGTEAAAGVIQIFTKKGTSGVSGAKWNVQVDQGTIFLPEFGTEERPYFGLGPFVKDGR